MEKYFGNVLSSFETGVQLDLRVKLAVEFLKAPVAQHVAARGSTKDLNRLMLPSECATWALDLATALIEEAAARGLLKDLPDNGEISAPLKHHVERSVAAAAYQAEQSQRAASMSMRGPMGLAVPGH